MVFNDVAGYNSIINRIMRLQTVGLDDVEVMPERHPRSDLVYAIQSSIHITPRTLLRGFYYLGLLWQLL